MKCGHEVYRTTSLHRVASTAKKESSEVRFRDIADTKRYRTWQYRGCSLKFCSLINDILIKRKLLFFKANSNEKNRV